MLSSVLRRWSLKESHRASKYTVVVLKVRTCLLVGPLVAVSRIPVSQTGYSGLTPVRSLLDAKIASHPSRWLAFPFAFFFAILAEEA